MRARRTMMREGALACALLAHAPAMAQTASQITPPSFAPPVAPKPAPIIVPEGGAAEAPPGAEALEVTPGALTIEGLPADAGRGVDDAVAAARARLVGHRIKASEIFTQAHAIETAFAREGRVLVRVVVPAQSVTDGATLRLTVIDGVIARIDTSAVPPAVRARVARVLRVLVGRPGVRLATIERRLLLAGDVPGVTLRSTIAAGATPGTSVLLIGASYRPVRLSATLDNTLPDSLGRLSYGLGLNFNGVFGQGELLYLRANGLPNTGAGTSVLDATPRDRALAAGLIVPIGDNGFAANLEATDARTAPRTLPGLFGVGSRFRRVSARLRYPVVERRAFVLTTEAAFDAQEERVRIIDPVIFPLSRDRLRIARGTADALVTLPAGARLSLRGTASFGLDVLGARSAADADPIEPLSRDGADDSFRKLEIAAGADVPLARHLALSLHGRAQTGFGDPLLNSEQIGLATLDGISPLPSGTLEGDSGYVTRGEVQVPLFASFRGVFGSLTPYGFGAYGGVRFERPSAFERAQTDAHAFGGGVRLGAATRGGSGLSATVEWGRAYIDGLAGHVDRVSFALSLQL